MNFNLLLDAATAASTTAGKGGLLGGGSNGYTTIIFFVVIILIFYFFMIRPQQRKQKAAQLARNAMKAGDKVVTAGGIHGKIKEVTDTYCVIEISENVKIKVDKVYLSVTSASNDQEKK